MRARKNKILRRVSECMIAAIYEATRTYTGTGDFVTDAAGWDGGTLPGPTDDWVIAGDGVSTGVASINDGDVAIFATLTIDPNGTGATMFANGAAVMTGLVRYPSFINTGITAQGTSLTINGDISLPDTGFASEASNPLITQYSGTLTINGDVTAILSQNLILVELGSAIINGSLTSSSNANYSNALTAANGSQVTITGDVTAQNGCQFAVQLTAGGVLTVGGNVSCADGAYCAIQNEGGVINTVAASSAVYSSTGSGISVNNVSGAWLANQTATISDPNIVPGLRYTFPPVAEVEGGVSYYDNSLTGTGVLIDPTTLENSLISAMTTQGYTTARAAKLDNLDAAVSSRSTYGGGAADAQIGAVKAKTDLIATNAADSPELVSALTAVGTIAGTTGNTQQQTNVRAAMTAQGYTTALAAQLPAPEIPASGNGSADCTLTITVGSSPPIAVSGASVWITSDSAGHTVVAGTSSTDASGHVTFLLTPGLTYYLWMARSGLNSINGQSFVAVADA